MTAALAALLEQAEAFGPRRDLFTSAGYENHGERLVRAELLIETLTTLAATVDELEAPSGTVVHSVSGTIACQHDVDHGVVIEDERPFSPWSRLQLPASVLYTPDREA